MESTNVVSEPIKPPPKINPTPNGTIPNVDLYIAPVIAPHNIFLFNFDVPINSSSKNKFNVDPTK